MPAEIRLLTWQFKILVSFYTLELAAHHIHTLKQNQHQMRGFLNHFFILIVQYVQAIQDSSKFQLMVSNSIFFIMRFTGTANLQGGIFMKAPKYKFHTNLYSNFTL